jgi:hypothetical protein
MFGRKSLVAVVSLACLLLSSSPAYACACCVNPGFYQISTLRPASGDLEIIGDLKFATASQFYMSEAGFDMIRGLDDLKKDSEAGKSTDLSVVQTFMDKTWRLTVRTGAGREGTLQLPMPSTMVKFKVDLHDNAPNTETSLYKEFRFKGTVAGSTGFFRKGLVRPTSYFLVFQGRGNGCDNSSDFTHWRLELDGPRADYAFFGTL